MLRLTCVDSEGGQPVLRTREGCVETPHDQRHSRPTLEHMCVEPRDQAHSRMAALADRPSESQKQEPTMCSPRQEGWHWHFQSAWATRTQGVGHWHLWGERPTGTASPSWPLALRVAFWRP